MVQIQMIQIEKVMLSLEFRMNLLRVAVWGCVTLCVHLPGAFDQSQPSPLSVHAIFFARSIAREDRLFILQILFYLQ